jgi:hypothetical protein
MAPLNVFSCVSPPETGISAPGAEQRLSGGLLSVASLLKHGVEARIGIPHPPDALLIVLVGRHATNQRYCQLADSRPCEDGGLSDAEIDALVQAGKLEEVDCHD